MRIKSWHKCKSRSEAFSILMCLHVIVTLPHFCCDCIFSQWTCSWMQKVLFWLARVVQKHLCWEQCLCEPTQISGALHSTTTSGLNFRQLPVVNGSAFPEYPKQTQQFREVYPDFRKFILGGFLSIQRYSQNLQRVKASQKWFQGRGWREAAIHVPLGTSARLVFTWFASSADITTRVLTRVW